MLQKCQSIYLNDSSNTHEFFHLIYSKVKNPFTRSRLVKSKEVFVFKNDQRILNLLVILTKCSLTLMLIVLSIFISVKYKHHSYVLKRIEYSQNGDGTLNWPLDLQINQILKINK